MKAVVTACTAALAALVIALTGLFVLADADALDLPAEGGLKGVPAEYRPWLTKAARDCSHPEITPALLAAQLNQESRFSTGAVSDAGARGPAQFMPASWDTWGRDADSNGVADPTDVGDAVTAQGRMMCSLVGQAKSSGYADDPRELALAGYNAGWGAVEKYEGIPPYAETRNYVQVIVAAMKQFQGKDPAAGISGSGAGAEAARKAASRIGTPYSWGGGTPSGPSTGFCDGTNGYLGGRCSASRTVGFDCSSLVQYAYWDSLKLPRTAEAQYGATSDRPVARADLRTGDLLFWANRDGHIYHVAIYKGGGEIIQAPRTTKDGKTVAEVEAISMDKAMPPGDYRGATRP